MIGRSLRCSFCRRSEDDVAKLVAGPRVYICDHCVAIATEMMNAPVDPDRRWSGARRSSPQATEVLSW
jgi:ATP-dependent Clp protease ATP-binding subunit ClpX